MRFSFLRREMVSADFGCTQHAAAKYNQERCDPRRPTKASKNHPEAYFQDEALNELYVARASIALLF